MPWSFNARGMKEECLAQIGSGAPPDAGNAHQFEVAMAVIKDELDHYGDDSTEMSISASGHAPDGNAGDRSLSIWISGKAVPAAKPAPDVSAPLAEGSAPHPEKRRR